MNITEKESAVIKAFGVSDYGDHKEVLWMWEVKDNSGLTSKSFSGVCASLHEKGLIMSDTEGDKGMMGVKIEDTYTIQLTEKGLEIFNELFNNKTKSKMKNLVSVSEVSKLNVTELRKVATGLEIANVRKLNKADLLKAVEAAINAKKAAGDVKKGNTVTDTSKADAKKKVTDSLANKVKNLENEISTCKLEIANAKREKKAATDEGSKLFQTNIIQDNIEGIKERKEKIANLKAGKSVTPTTKSKMKSDAKKAAKSSKAPKAAASKKDDKKKKPATTRKSNDGKPKMTELIDATIKKGGTWENICKKLQAESDERGLKMKYTKGVISAHIKFREKQTPGWMKELKMKSTDKGITKK